LRPDYVVLSTSIWNEGFAGRPQSAIEQQSKNLAVLVEMVKSHGAKPVIVGIYPGTVANASTLEFVELVYQAAESLDAEVWDFWGGTADSSAGWLTGMSKDRIHPTDAGHRAMFESIPTSYFAVESARRGGGEAEGTRAWVDPRGSAESPSTILVSPSGPVQSWTLSAWIEDGASVEEHSYFGAGEAIRLSRQNGLFVVAEAGQPVLISRAPTDGAERTWTHVALSYQAASGRLQLYLNGIPSAEGTTMQPTEGIGQFRFGGGCRGCAFRQVTLFRSPLSPGAMGSLSKDGRIRRSQEFHAALDDDPARGAQNLAPTLGSAIVVGEWVLADAPKRN
jgi:hypothetical protein